MTTRRDADGQPLNKGFNAQRLEDSAVDELIGICRGVLSNGHVDEAEAEYLLRWMDSNRDAAHAWPTKHLYRRLREMLVDNKLDVAEQGELLEALVLITGGATAANADVRSMSSTLPLCVPAPEITFWEQRFCFTGKFAFGSRKACEEEVRLCGGMAQAAPTKTTNYVVIGCMGSKQWIHTSWGRKIEEAVALRDGGAPLRIVSEEHWVRALDARGEAGDALSPEIAAAVRLVTPPKLSISTTPTAAPVPAKQVAAGCIALTVIAGLVTIALGYGAFVLLGSEGSAPERGNTAPTAPVDDEAAQRMLIARLGSIGPPLLVGRSRVHGTEAVLVVDVTWQSMQQSERDSLMKQVGRIWGEIHGGSTWSLIVNDIAGEKLAWVSPRTESESR